MTEPLKVLQLGTVGPLYGAERWILALIRNLDSAQVESHIAVIADQVGADAPLLDAAEHLGFTGHSIDAPGRFNWAAVRGLRDLVSRGGFDIVHSHGYKADILAWLALRGTATKIVSTPHGWSTNAGVKLRLYEWLGRRALRHFDAVVPLSADLYQGLVKDRAIAKRLHQITNGVDIDEISEVVNTPAELVKFREAGPVVGYIGQLIARKDISTLLTAFAKWGRDDARLVLVGEGDARGALDAQAKALGIINRVLFTGFRHDRLAWLKSFDVFVLPSHLEGIPRCLMEAMAAGIPVIASDIPGNRDIVHHEKTGLLFPLSDVGALATALDTMGSDAAVKYAEAGRQLIHDQFSARAMADAYADLFARL
jgi:glycosyltransferase involved in cell wall biosynthesis